MRVTYHRLLQELCGGTHVAARATSACSRSPSKVAWRLACGVSKRVCGDVAVALVQDQQALRGGDQRPQAQPQEVLSRVVQVMDNVKAAWKGAGPARAKLAASQGDGW